MLEPEPVALAAVSSGAGGAVHELDGAGVEPGRGHPEEPVRAPVVVHVPDPEDGLAGLAAVVSEHARGAGAVGVDAHRGRGRLRLRRRRRRVGQRRDPDRQGQRPGPQRALPVGGGDRAERQVHGDGDRHADDHRAGREPVDRPRQHVQRRDPEHHGHRQHPHDAAQTAGRPQVRAVARAGRELQRDAQQDEGVDPAEPERQRGRCGGDDGRDRDPQPAPPARGRKPRLAGDRSHAKNVPPRAPLDL